MSHLGYELVRDPGRRFADSLDNGRLLDVAAYPVAGGCAQDRAEGMP
jgi:hypothetical protein